MGGLGASPVTSETSRPDLCVIPHRIGSMSSGQTGHSTGQMGHVHGMVAIQKWRCPAKSLDVYCFFLFPIKIPSLRLLNALNSEDRGLKVRFSLAMIVFQTFEQILCQMLSSQGKNAPSNPYPHYLVRLATSRMVSFIGDQLLAQH